MHVARSVAAMGTVVVRVCLVVMLSLVSMPAAPRAGAAGGLAPAAGVLLDPQNYFGSGDITITSDTVFDTISGMVSPNVWGPGSADINAGGSGLTAFTANNITITAGAHVSYVGSYAFALLAKGNIVVSGAISGDGQGLPGGSKTLPAQGTGAGGMATSGGGGGGGSFGSQGGHGGDGNGTNTGGSPGVNYGPPNLSGTFPFLRGSGGGHGAVCNSSDISLGGAGGGGIALIALGTINLNNGVIHAKGGAAQSSIPGDGGNAGGSGGAVMIVAPAFTDAGASYVLAGGNGGNAGLAGCGSSLGGGGGGGGGRLTFITGSPSSGTLSLLPSLGGTGTGTGASGGTGGAAIPFGRPFVTLSAPNTGVAGSSLPFTATLAVGSASNYAWAFGDAGSANTPGSSTTHAYTTPGIYTLTVTAAMSGTGVLTSNSAVVTITEAPIGGLSAANSSPMLLGRTTYLSATISSGTNVTYTWSYGDGASGGGANAQHVYPAPGIYTASVTATNSISTTNASTNVSVLWATYLPLLRR